MTDSPKSRYWFQFSILRLLLAVAFFSLACGIAITSMPQLLSVSGSQGMSCESLYKPLLIGASVGAGLNILLRRTLVGNAIGLVLSILFITYVLVGG